MERLSVRQAFNLGCIKTEDGDVGSVDLTTYASRAAFRVAQSAELANRKMNLNLDEADNSGLCNYGGTADAIQVIRIEQSGLVILAVDEGEASKGQSSFRSL